MNHGGVINEVNFWCPFQILYPAITMVEPAEDIAIQESKDGKAVEWLEKVTDEQYPS